MVVLGFDFALSAIEAADVSGDGLPDLLSAALGEAHVHIAPLLLTEDADANSALLTSDPMATYRITAGDIDGDGILDAVVCQGAQLKIFAGGSPPQPSPSRTVEGTAGLCSEITVVGDLDDDGTPDLLVGELEEDGDGAIYVLLAGFGEGTHNVSILASAIVNGAPGEGVGTSAARAGDLDGDGRDDFWVGAPQADGGNGRIWLVPGDP